MDYITVDQFREQPEKVQKVLSKWHAEYHKISDRGIPIMYETELRRFIEEKTNGKIDIENDLEANNVSIRIVRKYEQCISFVYKSYIITGKDLLQAYWQVACKIAEEEL